jgi:hypothetical protein
MRSTILVYLAACVCLSAQVRFSRDQIAIDLDGKPFTTFQYGADYGRPFLAPLRSASGKTITRHFPMEQVPGESRDHLHHTGLWFSYDDVNGTKFWENDPSYTKPNLGRIVVRNAQYKDGDRSGTLTAVMEWRDRNGKILLLEDRSMVFYSDPKLRTIDFDITLTAAEDVTFGDTKEGAFAIRLADGFTERKGMKMVDADGRVSMANIWGKRSNWVDYSAVIEGELLGIAILDHPGNPRHPTYWHARDYGLFALNPFGRNAFDSTQEESQWKLPKGQKLQFRWRVIIHPGDAETARVPELYRLYSSGRN